MNLKKNVFVIVFLLIIIFFIKATCFLDPDFGWHLKIGEYIFQNGIPSTDPFSYTMPSFPFVDHEWLTNIVIYQIYSKAGYVSLAIIFTLLLTGTLLISLTNNLSRNIDHKRLPFKLFILMITAFGILLPYFGIRPQVQSWLYLSVLLLVLFNVSIWRRFKYALPLLFLVWVNMHGSFGAGIVILFFVLLTKAVRLRKINKEDLFIAFASLFATFINPYGIDMWGEVFQQLSDSSLRWKISEWRPAVFDLNFLFLFFVVLSSLVVWKYRKKFLLEEKGLFLVLLIQALGTTRHVPLWLVFAIPITSLGISYLYDDVKKIPHGEKRLKKATTFILYFCIVSALIQSTLHLKDSLKLTENAYYPRQAIEYLKSQNISGNIFAEYSWGGYLIWKYPEKKVFIDGRMPSWRWENSPENEESYAFTTYDNILKGKTEYKDVFRKYNIQTVLWQKQKDLSKLDKQILEVHTYFEKLLGEDSSFNFLEELEKDGWKKEYEDDLSVIYTPQ